MFHRHDLVIISQHLLRRLFTRLIHQGWVPIFLFLSTMMVAFVVQEGYEFAQVNEFRDQSVQLPILYSYADTTLFPGDILLQARDSYTTWLYPVLGILSRYVPLYALMLILYVASVGMTLTGIYFLAEELFPKKHVGLFAVLLWASWLPNPGGDFLRSAFPTHTTTAIGMQLLAMVFYLKRRYTPAAILLGLAANINAMTSVFIGATWVFGMMARREEWNWRLVRVPILIGITALPILWWRFSYAPAAEHVPMGDFVEIMRTRLWYAVFPFSMDVQLWGSFALVMLAWVLSGRYVTKETNRQIFWMAQGIVFLMLVGTIFTEIFPLEMVIQLQLLRSTWVLSLFAMLYFANMIAVWLNGKRWQILLALVVTVMLAAPRVVLELTPLSQPVPYEAYMNFDADYNQARLTPLGTVGLVVLVSMLLIIIARVLMPSGAQYYRRSMGWFAFACVLFAMPMFIHTNVPPEQIARTQDWRETLNWIRLNTPRDAAFITPPTMDGFRVTTERTSFSDWKDGTLLIFNGDLALEWSFRMELLGFNSEEFRFAAPTQEQICTIVTLYPSMDYAVVFNEWEIEGAPAFKNDRFSVIPVNTLVCPQEQA